MPRGTAHNVEEKVYTLPKGRWQWKVLPFAAFGNTEYHTEEGLTSKGGYEQIRLIIKVGDASKSINVFENLVFTDAAAWKITQFMKSAGIFPGDGVEYYLTAPMCFGLSGYCETDNEKPDGSKYERTNIVRFLETSAQHPESIPGFLMSDDASAVAMQAQKPETEYDDEIPW